MTSDLWVLKTIAEGYRLEFTARPPLFKGIRTTPIPSEPAKALALLAEVQALVGKGAVVRILDLTQGFYSTFFLTTKKSGDWRPIINLKPLNQYIRPAPFCMETLKSILQSIRAGFWGVTIDLKDAYLHVPVHPSSRKWLRFKIGDQSFEFRVLPFGLSTSPRVFTRIVKVVAEFLRSKGFIVFVYLDDFFILAESREALLRDLGEARALLSELGFLINEGKSCLDPSQRVQFLGAILDLDLGMVTPTPDRVLAVCTCAELVMSSQVVEAALLMRLLGLIASLVDLVPWCRLRMRPIQLHLASLYRPWVHPLHHPVPIPASLHAALGWWSEPQHLLVGIPFPPPLPTLSSRRTHQRRDGVPTWGSIA